MPTKTTKTTERNTVAKAMVIKGTVLFQNVYKPRENMSGKPEYQIVLRISKQDTKEVNKIKEICDTVMKRAKKELELTLDKAKAEELIGKILKDGDKHTYWKQQSSNNGHYIVELTSKNKPVIWKKEDGDTLVKDETPDLVSWGDKVGVSVNVSCGNYMSVYLKPYLNAVALIKKGDQGGLDEVAEGAFKAEGYELKTQKINGTKKESVTDEDDDLDWDS